MEKSPLPEKNEILQFNFAGLEVFAFTSANGCVRSAERPNQRSKILKNQTKSRGESGEEGANSLQEVAL